jgi:transcriptional regulator GlxA family with amidase domain
MTETIDPTAGWLRFYGGLHWIRREGIYEASVRRRLLDVRETLVRHPEAALDLETMAQAACFSKFHFLRLFREAYGETPGRYLARVRLERARTLLETTDRRVTDICLDVGYESLSSFTIAFRNRFGTPPDRYRRRWISVPRVLTPAARVPHCFAAMYG